MYEVKNLKSTPTPLPIPGRALILPRQGATESLRDREAESDELRALVRIKYVRLTKVSEQDPPEDIECPGYKEFTRINAVKAARERAARRARGELV